MTDPGGEPRARANPPSVDASGELARIEQRLSEIRGLIDTALRQQRHREFPPLRLAGVVAQFLALGMLVVGGVDWMMGTSSSLLNVLIDLGFATVLQLAALTALLVSRGEK